MGGAATALTVGPRRARPTCRPRGPSASPAGIAEEAALVGA